MDNSTIALIIAAITMVLYATNVISVSVTSLLSALAMAFFGIISVADAFSGFTSTAVLLIIGMAIVSDAFFHCGVGRKIGGLLYRENTSERRFVVIIFLLATLLSGLFVGSVIVATFSPIVDSIAMKSNGRIRRKMVYLPLGIGAVIGGNLTVIGSTSVLNASGILAESSFGRGFQFFETAPVILPALILSAIVFLTFGYNWQERCLDFEETLPASVEEDGVSEKITPKMVIVTVVLLGCIVCFAAGIGDMGGVAMLGALIVILTGCVDEKAVYQRIDWQVVLSVVGALGFAKGMDVSGAGAKLANVLVDVCTPILKGPFGMCCLILVIATVLSDFMSNNAAVVICAPIGIFIAQTFGVSPLPFVMAAGIGANLSVSTPIATSTITMTLVAGYRFKDYLKIGGVYNLLCTVVTMLSLRVLYF